MRPSRVRVRRRHPGFTILEVMVAVAILSLALTAIFSSEVGAIRVAQRARTTSVATMLARCKMAEVEEFVAREGLPAVEKEESDGCCEGAEVDGYRCDWRIERIVLPDPPTETLDDNALAATGAPGGALGGDDPISALAAGGTLASGGFGDLILSYAFPVLKPSIEEQVRRATVTVTWNEGERARSFDVVQYLVDDRGPAIPRGEDGELLEDQGAGGAGAGSGTDTGGSATDRGSGSTDRGGGR